MGQQVILLVGTRKGAFLFASDPGRRAWRLSGLHLDGWEVSSLLGDGRCGRRLFAGTCHMAYGATIRVSDDLGGSWRQLERGPAYAATSGLALKRIWQIVPGAPSERETLYAGVDEAGLFVSRDRGESWHEVEGLSRHPGRAAWTPSQGGLCLHSILVDPRDPRRLSVAISDGGFFRTLDGGKTWAASHAGLPRDPGASADPELQRGVRKVAQDPRDLDTLYLQHRSGVFRSSDGGASWLPIGGGLPGASGFPLGVTGTGDLYVAPMDPETRCFAGGKLSLYRLRNGRGRWEPLSGGLPEAPHFVGVLRDALAVDSLEPAGIYFGTTQGDLFYSADAGESWDRLPGQFSRITTVKAWITAGDS